MGVLLSGGTGSAPVRWMEVSKLSFLILHKLGEPDRAPAFLQHLVFCLRTVFPDHLYLYHDISLPLPEYVRTVPFDGIVLDVTFLAMRWAPDAQFIGLKQQYEFVRHHKAVKIALPQDEYDCNELLDEWLVDWKVDHVFSVLSSNWQLLFPKYHKTGSIQLGHTGYVDESLLEITPRPFDRRPFDIGYRTRKLPPYFGRLGETKWTIGRDVERLARSAGLKTNIVVGPSGTLNGKAWIRLINNCKFMLGANSGSSLLDPRGNIQRAVRDYLADHPEASFEEVERHCFAGLDGKHVLTALSPRVIEAALLGSCQILVEGEYSGIIQPWVHYIPIRPDAADFDTVLAAMRDRELVDEMVQNCRQAILGSEALSVVFHARRMMELASARLDTSQGAARMAHAQEVVERYNREMPPHYSRLWREARRDAFVRWVHQHPRLSSLARSANRLRKKLIRAAASRSLVPPDAPK